MTFRLRTFTSRRNAWTAHGLETVDIVVQARSGPHAAHLIRQAVDERFVEHAPKRRPAKDFGELRGQLKGRRRDRKAAA